MCVVRISLAIFYFDRIFVACYVQGVCMLLALIAYNDFMAVGLVWMNAGWHTYHSCFRFLNWDSLCVLEKVLFSLPMLLTWLMTALVLLTGFDIS